MFNLIISIFLLFIMYVLVVFLINFIFNKRFMKWLFKPIGIFWFIEWVNAIDDKSKTKIVQEIIKPCCFNCKSYKYKHIKVYHLDKLDDEFIHTCNGKYHEGIIDVKKQVCHRHKINKKLVKMN